MSDFKKNIKKFSKIIKGSDDTPVVSKQRIRFPGGMVPIHETQPNDVFVVGFPKSGNTLMQHILTHLIYGVNSEVSRSLVNLMVPDIYANSHYFRFNERCYFKSHDRPQPHYKKVIYLVRDGRDALLSYYHMKKRVGRDIPLLDLFNGSTAIYEGRWHEHIEAWEENPYKAEILWVKFEDLKEKKPNELRRICKFLAISRTEEELEAVVHHTSFEAMKQLETKPDWIHINKTYFKTGGTFLRKGDVNSYKEEVTQELLDLFYAHNEKTLLKYYSK